ncbi:MAG: hypothetical protein D6714_14190, partial [Bacteroidetes bacterium]
ISESKFSAVPAGTAFFWPLPNRKKKKQSTPVRVIASRESISYSPYKKPTKFPARQPRPPTEQPDLGVLRKFNNLQRKQFRI